MIKREFPILEFDEDRNAFVRPSNVNEAIEIAERCVLCYFRRGIEKILAEHPHREVSEFRAATLRIPIYEVDCKGGKIILVEGLVGAPLAAGQIEELSASGCKKFIACGMCGVLEKDIAVGKLIIPTSAIRDEGTSYHYAAPSREIATDRRVIQVIEDVFNEQEIPYIKTKTWTTDAFYRETPQKIALRKSEGCVCVEMENSALVAAARYNNAEFGQILCAGDSLAGEFWDSRQYNSRDDLMDFTLRVALDVCLRL